MASSSLFPIWVSSQSKRGRDLLQLHQQLGKLLEAPEQLEINAIQDQLVVSNVYFKRLFGVDLREYLQTVGTPLDSKPANPECSEKGGLHSSEEEALAPVGKERIPWRQWPRCARGFKCLRAAGSECLWESSDLRFDGDGKPYCSRCLQGDELVSTATQEEEEEEEANATQGLWFVKYCRTIVPVIICTSCGYGRPQSRDKRWHGGFPNFRDGWAATGGQPTFVCGRCQGGMHENDSDMGHESGDRTGEHDSALSGTPLWQLHLQRGDDSLRSSPDSGMPFPGWELTSEDGVIFHDRVCVYYKRDTGKYFIFDQKTQQYVEQLEEPRLPAEAQVDFRIEYCMRNSAGDAPAEKAGARCIIVKNLRKAGDLLKSPVPHLERGAMLIHASEHRGPAAADFVAKELPSRILAQLSVQRGDWPNERVNALLQKTIVDLDCDFLTSTGKDVQRCSHGCSLVVVLVLGCRCFIAGLGSVQCIFGPSINGATSCIAGQHTTADTLERQRVAIEGGWVDEEGHVRHLAEKVEDNNLSSGCAGQASDATLVIRRVLEAPHIFAALGISWPLPVDVTPSGLDSQFVQSVYRKQAVRVHPDKVPPELAKDATRAFERLALCRQNLEELLEAHGADAIVKLCRALTSSSDYDILGVDADADTSVVALVSAKLQDVFMSMGQGLEARLGLARVQRAHQALQHASSPPKFEAVRVTRAIGLQDLKSPVQLITAQPSLTSMELPEGSSMLAMLSPALPEKHVLQELTLFDGRPRAAMLSLVQMQAQVQRHCSEKGSSCICVHSSHCQATGDATDEQSVQPMKKQRIATSCDRGEKESEAPVSVRVRHILLRHHGSEAIRGQKAKRVSRTLREAELEALAVLRILLSPGGAAKFPRLAREKSECISAQKPTHLAGDCGWVSRRQSCAVKASSQSSQSLLGSLVSARHGSMSKASQELGLSGMGLLGVGGEANFPDEFVEAALSLERGQVSDLVSTKKGIHVVQRLA